MSTNTLPSGGYVETRELGALLGTDPQISTWTLWQMKAGNYQPTDGMEDIATLAEYLHDPLVEYVRQFTPMDQSRRPQTTRVHKHLTLRGAPDLVIEKASAYGDGSGIVIVRAVTRREWAAEWTARQPWPWPPANVMAEMQGLYLLSDLKWGIVVPVVDWRRPEAPIQVGPDTDLKDRLAKSLEEFSRSLDPDNLHEPEPDQSQNEARAALKVLARTNPKAIQEPTVLTGQEAKHYEGMMREVTEAEGAIEEHQEQIRGIATATQNARDQILALTRKHGRVQIGERTIWAEEQKPRTRSPHESWIRIRTE